MAGLAVLLARSDVRIRFFRPIGLLEPVLVPRHPFRCLNGIEMDPLKGITPKVTPRQLVRMAQTATGPGGSLVFQYGERACGALFCGESRFSFLEQGESVRLDRPMVIAAPGQGGVSLDRVYDRIVSSEPDRDVWVRGFRPAGRKCAPSFKAAPVARCLNDCRNQTIQEILLHSDGSGWSVLSGGLCPDHGG